MSGAGDRGEWAAYVAAYHDAHAGITEDLLDSARDAAGRSPYEWLLEAVPPDGMVVDLACGSAPVVRRLETSGARLAVGVDRSAGMLGAARTDAPLVRGDALDLPVPDGGVDGVVCGFALRNFLSLGPFLAECARVLRPGGRLALLEVSEPENAVLRWGHGVYFGRVVPLVGGLLSDRDAYQYLPNSVAYLPPPNRMVAMLSEAGFGGAARRPLSTGIAQLLTGTRR